MTVSKGQHASAGRYIWMPGEPNADGGAEGWAEYDVFIPEPGDYSVWARVIAWDGKSDSFFITWTSADSRVDPNSNGDATFVWDVAGGAEWHWERVTASGSEGSVQREWRFDKAGKTALRISVREDGTKLDALFVTSNTTAVEPEDAQVRLPMLRD